MLSAINLNQYRDINPKIENRYVEIKVAEEVRRKYPWVNWFKDTCKLTYSRLQNNEGDELCGIEKKLGISSARQR